MGGANRQTSVTGPLGAPVDAAWRLDGATAIIESARAIGLELVGGAVANDPVGASSRGLGELIVAAIAAGARSVLVGLGGSATSDGGVGALAALDDAGVRFTGANAPQVEVGYDVTTVFTAAARVFGPQKGADSAQVQWLTEQLNERREEIRARTGLDLDTVVGSGAAGGLAGALAARGARLQPGFEVVAAARGLDAALAHCELVITGEGRLDATSMQGKVVGAVLARAHHAGLAALVVVGQADRTPPIDLGPASVLVDLTERFGPTRAQTETVGCVHRAVTDHLAVVGDRT